MALIKHHDRTPELVREWPPKEAARRVKIGHG